METKRKETVKPFENHPNRNVLLKDFEKSEEINSKNLITEMGNTEIFEFFETSENGFVFCTRGKCVQPTKRVDEDRFDMLSIPGYVMKKNQSRGAGHGQSLRQKMYHKARDVLRKAQNAKNGQRKTILERWFQDAQCRANLSEHGWTEEQIRQYDALALEDPEERRRWEKNWHIVFNEEGKQGPTRQRPDFCEAKQTYRQLCTEHVASTGDGICSIHPVDQTRQKSSTTIYRFRGVQLHGSPSNWMDILPFNKFVFIRALAARRLEVKSKLGLLAIFNLD